ncbi:hypothetical protein JOF56_008655 [Kibdelosporangium banguiense]|uniref:PucR C-terminal helix-turn-helix domain-containing protein n=1 Tax=Kibdelosporangium banguiense TaxID=1365924 RepID=A0ABS4TV41_9PSEU|nr:PucR family transcriptional regulator [Kibdelosporangium banguiense]MBP2328270.1 hypothetical protein [Kibdelosporangium banguiense]
MKVNNAEHDDREGRAQMPDSAQDNRYPPRTVPAAVASWLLPEIPRVAQEMIDAIRHEVPAYNRPLNGAFGVALRLGVEQGLRQFMELITNPGAPQEHNAKIYRRLGQGEWHEGRGLDALQAAYRVGARVAWRQYGSVARRAGFSAEITSILAEAVFAHISGMAAESVKGYAQAQAAAATTLQRSRERLFTQLMSTTPVSRTTLEDLARQARWPLPSTAACVAIEAGNGASIELTTLPQAILASTDDTGQYLLIPDSEIHELEPVLHRVLGDKIAVIGLTVPLSDVRHSLLWARQTLQLAQRGAIPRKSLIHSTNHLCDLLLLNDEHLARQVSDRTIGVFQDMTPGQRDRLASTLLAWLTSTGRSAPEVATLLSIHPQTVRYRMHQLSKLFGERLSNPDFRFEAEAALRASALLKRAQNAGQG